MRLQRSLASCSGGSGKLLTIHNLIRKHPPFSSSRFLCLLHTPRPMQQQQSQGDLAKESSGGFGHLFTSQVANPPHLLFNKLQQFTQLCEQGVDYAQFRPDYPQEIYDAIYHFAGWPKDSKQGASHLQCMFQAKRLLKNTVLKRSGSGCGLWNGASDQRIVWPFP